MDSHRQRGHSMFEKMRANHLQVWLLKLVSLKGKTVILLCPSLSHLFPSTLVCVLCFSYEPLSGSVWAPSGCVWRPSCLGRELCSDLAQGCCWAKTGCKTLPKDPIGPDYAFVEKLWDDQNRYSVPDWSRICVAGLSQCSITKSTVKCIN